MKYANYLVSLNSLTKTSALDTAVRFELQIFGIFYYKAVVHLILMEQYIPPFYTLLVALYFFTGFQD